jgi:hypothetical protein
MTATYIVCPAGLVTGGPELLHQLAATLRAAGRDAHILYHPFDRPGETPPAYAQYNVSVARREDIRPGDIIVLPEVYTTKANEFPDNRVFLWWLSVDNFRKGLGSARVARLLPRWAHGLARSLAKRMGFLYRFAGWLGRKGGMGELANVELHLHQSEFARQFLEAQGLAPTAPLGDYINDDYRHLIANPPTTTRENLVTFNPLKGAERTQRIIAELATRRIDATPMPIQGYTRDQVRDLLSRAKLYIDFGNHPGKDRIPREAAAMGACVIVNRRGSAGNAIDVPLPDDYKVDDEVDGFEVEAAEKIRTVLTDFVQHTRRQTPYRQHLASEHEEFIRQSLTLFP